MSGGDVDTEERLSVPQSLWGNAQKSLLFEGLRSGYLCKAVDLDRSGNKWSDGAAPASSEMWLPEGSVLRGGNALTKSSARPPSFEEPLMPLCSFEESIKVFTYQQIGGILHIRVGLHFLLLDTCKSLYEPLNIPSVSSWVSILVTLFSSDLRALPP